MADEKYSNTEIGNEDDIETDFGCAFDHMPLDSGIHSIISNEKSSVQNQYKHVDKLTEKVRDLNVSNNSMDDEGCSMTSEKSFDSESSQCCSLQEPQEIEIDLYATDDDGDTLIHIAIVSVMREFALALISIASDSDCLNIQNYLHQSPLHLAVLTGQTQVVNTLIEKGADVTLRDQQGNTPLHIACRTGDKGSVTALVQSFGGNVSGRKKYFAIKNCEGLTCVHIASLNKKFIILGHLFAKGADVNIADAKSGRTILHYAAENRDKETVRLLLTHQNIDVDCKTFKGETPLVLAFWRNAQDIVKMLRSKGAQFNYDLFEESDDESWS